MRSCKRKDANRFLPLSQWDTEIATVFTARLIFGRRVIRICQNIWNVNSLAFENHASSHRPTSGPNRILSGEFLKFPREVIISGQPQKRAVTFVNYGFVCVAQPSRGFDQSIEHGLQIDVELLMTFSTSDVALCCSSASSRSSVSNSTFLFRRAAAEPRRRATLGVLWRLVMRRRFPLLRRLLHARSDRKCGFSRALKPHTKFPLRKLWTGLQIDIDDYFDRG